MNATGASGSGKKLVLKKKIVAPKAPEYSSPNAAKLGALVVKCIADAPYDFEGVTWACAPQPWWTERLGFSVETLRRIIRKPPFARRTTHVDGKPVTLIRVGSAPARTKKHVQNILAKIWYAKTGRRIVGKPYGHLGGLADAWGYDKAPEIFGLVLSDVQAFMAGAKLIIAQTDGGFFRYSNDFPPTGFILRFHQVGIEMYVMKEQDKQSKQAFQALKGSGAGFSYHA